MSDIVFMEALAAGAYAAMRTLSQHDRRRTEPYVTRQGPSRPSTGPPRQVFLISGTKPKTTQAGPSKPPGAKPKTAQPGPSKPKPGAKPKTAQPGPSKPKPGSSNYVAGFSKLSKAQQAELRAAQAKIDALKRAAAKGK